MKWIKKGLIFTVDNNFGWMRTHAQGPEAEIIGNRLRIYFSCRDEKNRSQAAYIETEAEDPQGPLLYLSDTPLLPLGKKGSFDDSGIMVSSVLDRGGVKYLYYTGWALTPDDKVPYRLAIGVALSEDGGKVFKKYLEGPILDRTSEEPYAVLMPSVMPDGNRWKMWYGSCTHWGTSEHKRDPFYHIKYAESDDGVHWDRPGIVCIDYEDPDEAIGHPCVFKEAGTYKMFYSYRKGSDFRNDRMRSYRIGYAESKDGITWVRMDERSGIDISQGGWDSEMIAYAHVYTYKDNTYMLYSGNGFGRSGFGYAVLEKG